jgi:hypothetical protein
LISSTVFGGYVANDANDVIHMACMARVSHMSSNSEMP